MDNNLDLLKENVQFLNYFLHHKHFESYQMNSFLDNLDSIPFSYYYFNILNLKELTYEKLFAFDYQILISKGNPLKDKDIYMKDLKKQIELKHGDIHIQEDHHNHKHMNIYERGIQFELLNEIPETYMWVAPMPKKLLKQNDFVLKACKDKKIPYVDYLIYRKGYVLSKEDQNFIECLKNVIEQVK